MRRKLAVSTVVAAFVVAVAMPAAASAAPKTLPLNGVTCTALDGVTPAPCSVEVTDFTTGPNGTMNAVMKVTNTVTGATAVTTAQLQPPRPGTCTILDLVIPPITLELLGLIVETDTIHIRITAQRGTLFGNLLCGLFFPNTSGVGLLDGLLRQGGLTAGP